MKKKQPLISVVMPVYNAGSFLVDAIESILRQTYQNFEFIIVDDASTDTSLTILKSYAKRYKKIKILRNTTNKGVSTAVKKAIKIAKGAYLARMDADDIAHPKRLEKQIKYLLAHPATVALGTQCFVINHDGKVIGEKKFPQTFAEIYKYIYRFIPLQQPTLMINRKKLPKNFTYYVNGMNTAEEVELFFKLFKYGKVENLGDYLLFYRLHNKNTSLSDIKKTFLLTLVARIKAIFYYGYKPDMTAIILTFLQAIIVLLLPKSFVFILYKLARKMSYIQFPAFIPKKLSLRPTISL